MKQNSNHRPQSSPENTAPAIRTTAKKRPFSSQPHATEPAGVVFPDAPKTSSFSRWSSSKCWSMGAKLNSANSAKLVTPGPGAYSPGQATLPAAPRYSFSPRFDQKAQARMMAMVPGPGTYVPINPKHKPKNISIGQKLTYGDPFAAKSPPESGKVTPGPGQYDVVEVTTFTDHKASRGGMRGAPMWSFGLKTSHVTGGVPINNTPGPGAYPVDMRQERGPSYSINPRLPHTKRFQTPGPGTYDISYGCTHKGKFPGPRSSIHARLNPPSVSNSSTPGPGQYEAPQQFWATGTARPRSSMS